MLFVFRWLEHQDPVLGQTNYVYVQVRNIGNAPITDGYLDVYWHEPSTAVACGAWAPINPDPIPVGSLGAGSGGSFYVARSKQPRGKTFTIIMDGGCMVVRVIFDAENKSIVSVECNGVT